MVFSFKMFSYDHIIKCLALKWKTGMDLKSVRQN
jgi:hypothetical protein